MNKEYKFSIPMSTANLACGFDSFGLALDLVNTYTFKESESMSLNGFKEEYNNDDNLCMKAYIDTFKYLNKELINASITISQNIPNCGGLGSSANVIIAGIMGANLMCGNIMNMEMVTNLASSIEGHPDNVVPEIYGGFTSSVKCDDNKIKYFKYKVSDLLVFTLLVPGFSLNTHDMRKVLPEYVSMEDAIYNLSRSANVAKCLSEGNFIDLKELLKDKLHQQYRINKITNANKIFDYAYKNNYIPLISGSGASLLIISQEELKEEFDGFKKYNLKPNNEGIKIYG